MNLLIVAREAYKCHYDDLDAVKRKRCLELMACAVVEYEDSKLRNG